MAKQPTTVWDVDVSKMMSELKLPHVDLEAMIESQRKNIEAITQANKLAFEGMQAVARRQTDVMRQMSEDMSGMMSQMRGAGSAEDKVAKQADITKQTYESVLANMKELGEMMTKANTEAADVIHKRIGESLDELKSLAAKK